MDRLRPRTPSSLPLVLLAALLPLAAAGDAAAQYEIGANDFRISFAGGTGDPDLDAGAPAVAFNPDAGEYLAVWAAPQVPAACGPGFAGEAEIVAQRIDAGSGALLGAPQIISDVGPPCDDRFEPTEPAVAFDPVDDLYLVVWSGDDDVGGLVDGELEIFGQLLTATGAETGADDFRISDVGGTGDPGFRASAPATAFDPDTGEYLVVWWGDDDVGGLVDQEFEIFGQRLTAAGAETGANDFRISDMGDDGDPEYEAAGPAVAYSRVAGEYLVVWDADDDQGGVINGEREIFGQILDGQGAEIGTNDFRISEQGGSGDGTIDATTPDVAASTEGGYLVVWQGNPTDQVSIAREIFGQVLDLVGSELGSDFRISDLGGDDPVATRFNARRPSVAYSAADHEYLVAWDGDDNEGDQVASESEIYVQRIDGSGAELGANDFRISDLGPPSNASYDAFEVDLAAAGESGRFLAVWQGDDDRGGLVDNEFEVFGQRLIAAIFADGFESGDTSGWTAAAP